MKKSLLLLLSLGFASASSAIVFINEIHYDNASGDVGEAVEVAGTAGDNLSGYSIVLYNGSNGTEYGTTALSGILPDDGSGGGTLSFLISGIQNGGPDGMALLNGLTVVEFISYEGSFMATNGPASGMTSVDIGVSETSTTPIGQSLQRIDNGDGVSPVMMRVPGVWIGPVTSSFGAANGGQTLPVELMNFSVE